jgi:Methyltransferase domain
MASLSENLEFWRTKWDWSGSGDEWSRWWGDTPSFWHGAILPRIHTMLPVPTILEIAPGYGRWTQYLKDGCRHLELVDLAENCIEHCRERFADSDHIEYHVNDGRSLAMIEDHSVDFAFSFDSLVHVEPEVIGGYLAQLAHKLTPGGVGFIHHSNAGTLKVPMALSRRLPPRLFNLLRRRGIAVDLIAWRDPRMTGEIFRRQCHEAGLACVSQELVSWEFGRYPTDCFSVIAAAGSCWDRPTRTVRNHSFGGEARRMAELYANSSFR